MIIYGSNKNPVDADEFGNLKTRSITRAEVNDSSNQEKMYSITSSYTTSGADEEVIYIKNTSSTENFEIHRIHLGTAVNAVFTISKVTGTAGGAGAITPVNMNLGSTKEAELSCNGDASVTGLTIGGTLGKLRILANYSDLFDFQGSMILKPNTAIAITNSATGACEVTIMGHFNSLERLS